MVYGKGTLFLFLVLTFSAANLPAQAVVGSGVNNPADFLQIGKWLADPRPSLRQFENTIAQDFLYLNYSHDWFFQDIYMALEDQPGTVQIFPVSVSRVNFQGMFWGPLFTTAVWTPPAVITDLSLNFLGANEDDYVFPLTEIVFLSLKESLVAREEQNQEAVPVNGLFRLNLLLALDWLNLDFKQMGLSNEGESLFVKMAPSILGRTYMGLAIKLLEANYFFGGFSFIHYPRLRGYQDFLASSGYSEVTSALTYYASGEGADDANFLHETRSKVFFHNNFLDFFQLRALLNLDSSRWMDLMGGGFKWGLGVVGDWETDVNYYDSEEKWTAEISGKSTGDAGIHWLVYYAWDLEPLAAFRQASLELIIDFRGSAYAGFTLGAKALGQKIDDTYVWGGTVNTSFLLGPWARAKLELQYNGDPTMASLELIRNQFSLGLQLELDLDGSGSDGAFLDLVGDLGGDSWD